MKCALKGMCAPVQPPLSPANARSPRSPHSPTRKGDRPSRLSKVRALITVSLWEIAIAVPEMRNLSIHSTSLRQLRASNNLPSGCLQVGAGMCTDAVPLSISCLEVPLVTAFVMQVGEQPVIPRFYFPEGRPVASDVVGSAKAKMTSLLAAHPDGLTVAALKQLVKEVGFTACATCAMLVWRQAVHRRMEGQAHEHSTSVALSRNLLHIAVQCLCCKQWHLSYGSPAAHTHLLFHVQATCWRGAIWHT